MLVCPHCQTPVAADASVCRGCGAEIVRGATRRERALFGVVFALGAIPLLGIILHALEIGRGGSPFPSPQSDRALFVVLGLIVFFIAAYLIGRIAARRLFRRSQVRFFRTYRHQ